MTLNDVLDYRTAPLKDFLSSILVKATEKRSLRAARRNLQINKPSYTALHNTLHKVNEKPSIVVIEAVIEIGRFTEQDRKKILSHYMPNYLSGATSGTDDCKYVMLHELIKNETYHRYIMHLTSSKGTTLEEARELGQIAESLFSSLVNSEIIVQNKDDGRFYSNYTNISIADLMLREIRLDTKIFYQNGLGNYESMISRYEFSTTKEALEIVVKKHIELSYWTRDYLRENPGDIISVASSLVTKVERNDEI